MIVKLIVILAISSCFLLTKSFLLDRGSSEPLLIQNKHNNRFLQTTEFRKNCDSDSDCTDGDCVGTCTDNLCSYSISQCEACDKFRFHLKVFPGHGPKNLWWEIDGDEVDITFSPDDNWDSFDTREFSKCIDYGVYTFTMHTKVYGSGFKPYESFYEVHVNDILIEKVEDGGFLLPRYTTISACISDANCDDRNTCTNDKCNTERGICENVANTEFTPTCRTFGNPKVLALRVVAPDYSTTISASDLGGHIFGTNGNPFNMKSQFSACSRNRFNIVPFTGSTTTGVNISNGIGEVQLTQNVKGAVTGSVAELVTAAAQSKYGDLQSQFDFVMLCLPPGTVIGTSTNWKAYAYVNAWLSIYNDKACSYPSVQMHEIGHNIGLSHSNDEANYGDESGMMGISYNKTDAPLKCFNAPKSWQLGWFFESHVIVDVTEMTENLEYRWDTVCGVTTASQRSMIKIINSDNGLDYYLTFNRALSMNSGTGEGVNEVLVTQRDMGSSYADSKLIGTLAHIQQYTVLNIHNGLGLQIYVRVSGGCADIILIKGTFPCTTASQCNDFDSCTIDECTGGTCSYKQKSCSECGAIVSVDVFTNSFPEATIWTITNTNTEKTIRSSGHLTNANLLYQNSKCLEYGKYKFSFAYDKNETLGSTLSYKLMVGESIVDDAEVSNLTYADTIFTICSTDRNCLDYDGCTTDSCNPSTKLCDNTPHENDNNCVNCEWVSLEVISDNFPEETTWSVSHPTINDIVLSGDPYPINAFGFGRRKAPTKSGRRKAPTRSSAKNENSSDENRKLIQSQLQRKLSEKIVDEKICLEYEYLYYFIIKDSFGDGICCSEGNGSFKISVNDVAMKEGGNFNDADEIMFMFMSCASDVDCDDGDMCTTDSCTSAHSLCIYTQKSCELCGAVFKVSVHTDSLPHETSWKVSRSGTTLLSGGPYEESFNTFHSSKCLPYGSYKFKIYDSAGRGIFSVVSDNVGYYLSLNNEKVIEFDGSLGKEKEEIIIICDEDTQCDDGDLCTTDRCNVPKRYCEYIQLPCDQCGKSTVTVEFQSDYDGNGPWQINETTTNTIVMEGAFYSQDYKYYRTTKCLSSGSYAIKKFIASNTTCDLVDSTTDCPFTLKVNGQLIFQATSSAGEYKQFVIGSVSTPTKSLRPSKITSNIPSKIQSNVPSSIPTSSLTSLFVPVPSQSPSFYLSTNSADNDVYEWLIEFDHSEINIDKNSPVDLTNTYRVAKGKVASQLEVAILDSNCFNQSFTHEISVLDKEIRTNTSSVTNDAVISLGIDYKSIHSNSLWDSVFDELVRLSFCVRTSLLFEQVVISAVDIKMNIDFDLDAEVTLGLAVEKKEVDQVFKESQSKVSACICNAESTTCSFAPEIAQNSLIRICVTPADPKLRVSRFEKIGFFQDGIAKYNPISNGILDGLSRMENIESTEIIESPMIYTFFEDANPADVTIIGEVLLDFNTNNRNLVQREGNEAIAGENVGIFQLRVNLHPAKNDKLQLHSFIATSLMIIIAIFFMSRRKNIRYSRVSLGYDE